MDCDPEVVDMMQRLDPARLLPFERRWEAPLPKEQRLPRAFRGMLGATGIDPQSTAFERHPR